MIFEAFVQKPTQLISKAQLEDRLYSFDSEVESNAIEVHISRLRKKLGAAVIRTERGLGYRLGRHDTSSLHQISQRLDPVVAGRRHVVGHGRGDGADFD